MGDLFKGGVSKYRRSQDYRRKYFVSFFNMKYFDLSINRDGIKEEWTVALVKY